MHALDASNWSLEISHSSKSNLFSIIKSVKNFLVIPGKSLLLSFGVFITPLSTIKTFEFVNFNPVDSKRVGLFNFLLAPKVAWIQVLVSHVLYCADPVCTVVHDKSGSMYSKNLSVIVVSETLQLYFPERKTCVFCALTYLQLRVSDFSQVTIAVSTPNLPCRYT